MASVSIREIDLLLWIWMYSNCQIWKEMEKAGVAGQVVVDWFRLYSKSEC